MNMHSLDESENSPFLFTDGGQRSNKTRVNREDREQSIETESKEREENKRCNSDGEIKQKLLKVLHTRHDDSLIAAELMIQIF